MYGRAIKAICFKMKQARRLKLGLGEAGQATLEYILLLIIMIILILSLLYQFHDSFRIYAEAFFDGYIRCLLEVGELPGTGSKCAQEYTAFKATAGKTLLKNNLPDPGGGTGNGKTAPKTATAGRETKGGGGGGGGSAPIGKFTGNPQSNSVPIGKVENSSSGIGNKESLLGASNTMPGGRYRIADSGGSTETYSVAEEVDVDRPQKPKDTVATTKKVGASDNLRARKVQENLARKPAGHEEPAGSFTLSGFIRLLLIILIIVAMVIFFGGQLMQITRSREKGGD